jgi:hypothetical protein
MCSRTVVTRFSVLSEVELRRSWQEWAQVLSLCWMVENRGVQLLPSSTLLWMPSVLLVIQSFITIRSDQCSCCEECCPGITCL